MRYPPAYLLERRGGGRREEGGGKRGEECARKAEREREREGVYLIR